MSLPLQHYNFFLDLALGHRLKTTTISTTHDLLDVFLHLYDT